MSSRQQYDAEIFKHYDALKARIEGVGSFDGRVESRAVTDKLLKNYETYKELLCYSQQNHGADAKSGKPTANPPGKPDESPADPEKKAARPRRLHVSIHQATHRGSPLREASRPSAPRASLPAKPLGRPSSARVITPPARTARSDAG